MTAKKQGISELLEQSFSPQSDGRCWAQRLSGQAKEYIAALEERAAKGNRPVYARVQVILKQHFGVAVGSTVVSNHFVGRCGCPRR